MKKKELKKITDAIVSQVKTALREPNEVYEKTADYPTNPYSEFISNRFKKLVLSVIKYPDNISVSYSDRQISISIGDVGTLKKSRKYNSNGSGMGNVTSNGNENITFTIYKQYFSLIRGYNIASYHSDPNMYDSLIDIIKEKVTEINNNNFEEIFNSISSDSGLTRDHNLEELENILP